MRGHIISSMPKFMGFVKASSAAVLSKEFENHISPTASQEDIDRMRALRYALGGSNLDETWSQFDQVFKPQDPLWYTSLITFGLYTYLDVYSKSILQLVSDRPDAKHGLEAYLVSVANRQGDKSRPPVLAVREMSRFGMETRVRHLVKGFGIDSALHRLLSQEILSVHAGAFHRFLEIRHKIAHRNPRPGLDEYTYEDIEKDLDELILQREELGQQFQPAFLFHDAIETLAESLQEIGELIKKTALVVEMATTYPALVDSVLEVIVTM